MEPTTGRLIVEQVTGWSLVGYQVVDTVSRVPLFERIWVLDLTGNDISKIAALALTIALIFQVAAREWKKGKDDK